MNGRSDDIPERLRERVRALLADHFRWDLHGEPELIDAIATALYEIEQAARAEGERRGAERMREACAQFVEGMGHLITARHIRALPAPAVPAKEA